MKKISIVSAFFALALPFVACDKIDENEQLIPAPIAIEEEDPTESTIDLSNPHTDRYILAEEFTGQLCNNCPKAAAKLRDLHNTYGKKFTIVAIHAGSSHLVPALFQTEAGNAYASEFTPLALPAAMFNRKKSDTGFTNSNINSWDQIVQNIYNNETAPLNVGAEAHFTGERSIKVSAKGLFLEGNPEIADAMLQVLLVEDNIIADQILPNGTTSTTYKHQHVLRAAINGIWGEKFVHLKDYSYNYTINPLPIKDFVAEDYQVVVFVYNAKTKEVYDVTVVPITAEPARR